MDLLKRIVIGTISSLMFFSHAASSDDEDEMKMYGRIHVSADLMQHQISEDIDQLLSSNTSRFGIKGSEPLGGNYKAIWKLEIGIDVTGESSELSSRNRYVGLINPFGMVVAGAHDTPFKSLGAKVEVFPNTIADRRSVLGTAAHRIGGRSQNWFDVRAKNALMYVSPKIAGLELRLMRSAGQENEDDSAVSGNDVNGINSYSAVYRSNAGFIGAALEEHLYLSTVGVRVVAGVSLGPTKVYTLYEKLDSSIYPEFDRVAYGLSIVSRWHNFSFKGQLYRAEDYIHFDNSSGTLYAGGVSYHFSDRLEFYTLAARIDNKANSAFPLRGSSDVGTPVNGEFYAPERAGGDVWGGSAGVIYRF